MNSLMLLWKKVAEESATRCCTSTTMDWKTVQGRYEHEGFSFLTITLPAFGKDIEKCLDRGWVDRDVFPGFSWHAGLPRFLGGFLDRVFDRVSGRLLDEPCIDAIIALRQLTLMFGKIEMPCSDARISRALMQFVECEKDVKESDRNLSDEMLSDFCRVSRLLFHDVFKAVNRKIYDREYIPKHGPGATADKLSGNSKYRLRTWPARLDKEFPAGEFLIPSPSFYDELEGVDVLEPGAEIPIKVITVPKTLKTPRIIGIEPAAMQYAQQSVSLLISSIVDGDYRLRNLIGTKDQTPNQRMALDGSLFGELATLDLSEASDRVSNQLVRAMLFDYRYFYNAVDACRSRKADVRGHGVLRLAKFAPMGSALCFPMEAFVFCTLVFIGIEKSLNRPLTQRDIQNLIGRVRVYGDDIIVPVDYVRSVVDTLQAFGSVVNVTKSFWTGKFRESCGKEYYDGTDVSLVRVRRVFPTHRRCVPEIISLVSFRNQMYFSGYWDTCKWLDDKIRNLLTYFPTVLPSSPVLGRHSFLGYQAESIGPELHNPVVKGWVVSSSIPSDPLDGAGALLKFFLKRGGLPSADRKHLERAGRPQAVNIKLRMDSAI